LGLETKPHPRPYRLGWICGDNNLQVTKQCKIKFAITSKYVDEVELDIVPLDICGIFLGSPYLYDRKAIFYREENKYCFKKDGKEYIVRVHRMKTYRSFATIGKLKRMVNASKSLTLMSVTNQKESDAKHEMVKYVSNNHEVSQEVQHEVQLHTLVTFPVQKRKHVFSFSFTYSVLLFSLLLFSGVLLLIATKNVDECAIDGMITLINNVILVFMFVVVSQVIIFPKQKGWMIQDKCGDITLTSYLSKTRLLVVQKLQVGRLDLGGSEMLKNKSSPMLMKSTPLQSARRKRSGGVNGSKIRVCMRKLSQFEAFPKQGKSQ
jgi:hypothetical protein